MGLSWRSTKGIAGAAIVLATIADSHAVLDLCIIAKVGNWQQEKADVSRRKLNLERSSV